MICSKRPSTWLEERGWTSVRLYRQKRHGDKILKQKTLDMPSNLDCFLFRCVKIDIKIMFQFSAIWNPTTARRKGPRNSWFLICILTLIFWGIYSLTSCAFFFFLSDRTYYILHYRLIFSKLEREVELSKIIKFLQVSLRILSG